MALQARDLPGHLSACSHPDWTGGEGPRHLVCRSWAGHQFEDPLASWTPVQDIQALVHGPRQRAEGGGQRSGLQGLHTPGRPRQADRPMPWQDGGAAQGSRHPEVEVANIPTTSEREKGGPMVKIIWKHKQELVEELCRKAGIQGDKDKANLAKLNTSNLTSLLKVVDSGFKPYYEQRGE